MLTFIRTSVGLLVGTFATAGCSVPRCRTTDDVQKGSPHCRLCAHATRAGVRRPDRRRPLTRAIRRLLEQARVRKIRALSMLVQRAEAHRQLPGPMRQSAMRAPGLRNRRHGVGLRSRSLYMAKAGYSEGESVRPGTTPRACSLPLWALDPNRSWQVPCALHGGTSSPTLTWPSPFDAPGARGTGKLGHASS